jgi:5-methylcytosine-specific restriction endonuclease McrA
MLVFVINQNEEPLMPCSSAKARRLLNEGKAKVVRRTPFTIKLLFGSSGYRQEVVAGMDTASKTVGAAAISHGKVLYQSEVEIRQDVSDKMEQRRSYRRTRRNRKTRYRPMRIDNRASMRKEGRLAPSIRSKVESHLRERDFVESILPVSRWKVEVASFDIHQITNPDVEGKGYQEGEQKGYYNVKAYVLHRDNYTCQSGQKRKHSSNLHVHHIVFRSQGGSDAPSNLIVLCEECHTDLHAGKFAIPSRKMKTKHATEIGMVKSALLKSGWQFELIFGYETKFKREQFLGWEKSHAADAVAICCDEGEVVAPEPQVWYKRHIAKGDYRQTSGKRSERHLPTGKLFGLRKFDLVRTPLGMGFVKGKRSSGYFDIQTFGGDTLGHSIKATTCVRLTARTTTLTKGCEGCKARS